MELRIFSLLILIFFTVTASAQSLKISGKVLNDKNEPVSAATVQITNGTGTSTDIDGRFTLTLSQGSKYEVSISAVGYATKVLSDVEVLPGQVNELNIVLTSAS